MPKRTKRAGTGDLGGSTKVPELPVTDEFRAKLEAATSKHGTRKKVADVVGTSPTTLTKLVKPLEEGGYANSRFVAPICDHFGWPYPSYQSNELKREWDEMFESLDADAILRVLALRDVFRSGGKK